jgi:hypothetical protein
MVNLKEHGFEQIGDCWIFREGIYTIMHSKKTVFSPILRTRSYVDALEVYVENKEGEAILMGEIQGEESLKTVLNLIKNDSLHSD